MNDLKKAAQQALEALTASNDLLGTMYLKMDAITALRAALAQEDETQKMLRTLGFDHQCPESIGVTLRRWKDGYAAALAQQEQEPVAYTLYGKPVSVSDLSKDFTELFGFYSAPPRRETKQEPVAWMFQHEETKRMNYVSNDGCNGPGRFLVMNPRYALVCALYTTPPRRKWQGLTEEEIQSIHDTYHKRMGPQEFARAIEAKLKEKNNG